MSVSFDSVLEPKNLGSENLGSENLGSENLGSENLGYALVDGYICKVYSDYYVTPDGSRYPGNLNCIKTVRWNTKTWKPEPGHIVISASKAFMMQQSIKAGDMVALRSHVFGPKPVKYFVTKIRGDTCWLKLVDYHTGRTVESRLDLLTRI